jgi:hypothetical protein
LACAPARSPQQVNFPGVKLAVLSLYQDQLIAANRVQLRIYESELSRIMANAKAILETGKP